MTDMQKNRQIEAKIKSRLPETLVLAIDNMQRQICEMLDRHDSAQYKQMKQKAIAPNISLLKIRPEQWNNIPIPVSNAFTEMINHIMSQQNLQAHIEANILEITKVMETMMMYIHAVGEDVRGVVHERITLLNQKSGDDLTNCANLLSKEIAS